MTKGNMRITAKDEAESIAIQKHAFEIGYGWYGDTSDTTIEKDARMLLLTESIYAECVPIVRLRGIEWCDDEMYAEMNKVPEVSFHDFMNFEKKVDTSNMTLSELRAYSYRRRHTYK